MFSLIVAWSMRFALSVAIANAAVVTFDPRVFDLSEYEPEADLLLLVEKGRRIGRKPFDKALRHLDRGHTDLNRERSVLVAHCRSCMFYSELLNRWHIEETELPLALLFPERQEHSMKGKYRLYLGNATEPLRDIVAFIRDFDAGLLKPWIRSLPHPAEEEQTGPVREIVGSTFQHEVMEYNASVLLLFYAPWCGFSKMLQPVFAQIGHRVGRDSPMLRVARLDHDSNDHPPGTNVSSVAVPSIYLFRKGLKHAPELFTDEGNRTVDGIIDWMRPRVEGLSAWLKHRGHVESLDEDPFQRPSEEI